MRRYNPKDIEAKWQQRWLEDKTFEVKVDPDKPKKYIIDMFPYPSGAAMHVGHVRNFTISDVLSQFHRQKGYNVMHTMGWDTFGLPAENYAIKTGTPPAETTKANIANFKHQLQALGMSYDWSREINTSDPSYYKWTQWIFTKLFENDLAYQKESAQWWCPVDKTVLANEQVENGRCWRCGNEVVKKNMKQWFFRITNYADALLDGIDDLDWPEKIKTMQRNWIGRSKGASIKFQVESSKETVEVFTTRPDTIFGATFLVLAPEHEAVEKITTASQNPKVESYKAAAAMKSEIERQENKEKTGVFTGAYAANPANGEKIPIWVADYVLTGYGTGAIMAVPAHDERDNEFAQKFDLPVKRVVQNDASDGECTHDEGNMMNSGSYDGLSTSQAREKIVADLEKQGVAKEKVQYKMRDWLISRQRYWGAPIPIIHCPKDGAVAVPEKDLPVVLPEVKSFEPRTVRGTVSVDASEASSKKQEAVSAFVPTGEGSVLATATDWVHTTCPKCGGEAMRETDTMDGYACSSWYFLRYADPKNDQQAWDPAIANYWLPVDYYCGGDHAVSHLLYTRFWFHFFADQGLIEKTRREPVGKLVYNGYILAPDGTKMSKSKGNTINPDDLIEQGYGADSVRLFEMFIAPYEQNTSWNTNGVPGTYRFLQRIWTLVQEFNESDSAEPGAQNQESTELKRLTHKTIKRVSGDLEHLSFNTAVAAMMECVNELYKIKAKDGYDAREDWQFALASLTQLLAPFAPHIAEELWQSLGGQGSVHVANWPAHDEQYLVADAMTLAVQINGKVRAEITVATDAGEDDIKKAALAHERVQGLLGGSEPKRIIYVPGRLVNIVS